MSDFIREAGWPIYPILALGLSTLALALRHALVPQRSLLAPIVALGAATLLFGVFGTIVGVQRSIDAIREINPEERFIWLIGLKEALGCLVGALLCLVPATLVAGVGAYKMARRLEEIAARS